MCCTVSSLCTDLMGSGEEHWWKRTYCMPDYFCHRSEFRQTLLGHVWFNSHIQKTACKCFINLNHNTRSSAAMSSREQYMLHVQKNPWHFADGCQRLLQSGVWYQYRVSTYGLAKTFWIIKTQCCLSSLTRLGNTVFLILGSNLCCSS